MKNYFLCLLAVSVCVYSSDVEQELDAACGQESSKKETMGARIEGPASPTGIVGPELVRMFAQSAFRKTCQSLPGNATFFVSHQSLRCLGDDFLVELGFAKEGEDEAGNKFVALCAEKGQRFMFEEREFVVDSALKALDEHDRDSGRAASLGGISLKALDKLVEDPNDQ